MISASFLWAPGDYDDDFHRLNAVIEAVARSTPGYLGVESWRSADGTRGNAVYYWESLEALEAFAHHPDHLEAKRQYARWYGGYQVVVAQVLRTYGDGRLAHLTAKADTAPPT